MTDRMMPVVVTTHDRDVWFGYCETVEFHKAPGPIFLHRARHVFSWSKETQGVGGLAAIGPQRGSKIGPEIPSVRIDRVATVMAVDEAALPQWRSAKWAA